MGIGRFCISMATWLASFIVMLKTATREMGVPLTHNVAGDLLCLCKSLGSVLSAS